jgi:2-polyprenyl-6-methoxyphenol hydroxylase-like FAD-dependent oxidoreductase
MSSRSSNYGALAKGLKVGIVGGSITACAAAILLRRAGADVSLYERSSGNLQDRGVGLAMKISTLEELARRDVIDDDIGTVPVWTRTFARPHANPAQQDTPWQVFWEQPVAFYANHWGVLFRSLRKRVPDSSYHHGYEVVGAEQRTDGTVELRFDNHKPRAFDLVLFADGYESLGRRLLHPDVAIGAARYFLWRGMIDEAVLPIPDGHDQTITFFGYKYGHGFVYYVPSPEQGGDSARRVNWAFHETVAGKTIPGIEPDGDGYVRTGLRPGAASTEQIAYCREMAREYFPSYFGDVVEATPQPFIQPVMDALAPHYTRGRMALVGDAATLSRPHIGGGAGKALDDVLALVDMLAVGQSVDGVLAGWDRLRSAFGAEVHDLGRSLGKHLVEQTPDWTVMDQASMDQWWEEVQAGRYWFWVNEVKDKHPEWQ